PSLLIEAVGKCFQMGEQIVAQVKLNLARDADHQPSRQELEDALGAGNAQQHKGVDQELMASGAAIQVVHRALDHLRKQHPDSVVEEHSQRAPEEGDPVFLQVGQQRLQVLEHGFLDDCSSELSSQFSFAAGDHHQDGVLKIMYPPARPKITSGIQAATGGGSWLTFPKASNNPAVRK